MRVDAACCAEFLNIAQSQKEIAQMIKKIKIIANDCRKGQTKTHESDSIEAEL